MRPIVVTGVSGSGKSTVGAALARRLRVAFRDADDLHPSANIEKMGRGEPLDDHDRHPWLELVGQWLAVHANGGVMSCSALKRKYRDQIRGLAPNVRFVLLDGSPEVVAARQAARPGHFMPTSLLTSQFATLEPLMPDEDGIVLDIDRSVDAIVQGCVEWVTDEAEEN